MTVEKVTELGMISVYSLGVAVRKPICAESIPIKHANNVPQKHTISTVFLFFDLLKNTLSISKLLWFSNTLPLV